MIVLYRFRPAVDKIFLGKFHKEVGVQLNVELEVSRGLLGGSDVEIQSLVKDFDGLLSVTTFTPLEEGLQIY